MFTNILHVLVFWDKHIKVNDELSFHQPLVQIYLKLKRKNFILNCTQQIRVIRFVTLLGETHLI